MRGGGALISAVVLASATLVAMAARPSGWPAAALVPLATPLLVLAAALATVAAGRGRHAVRGLAAVVAAALVTALAVPALIAGVEAPPSAGPPTSAAAAEAGALRLLSWNSKGSPPDRIGDELRATRPDVAVFVETNGWAIERRWPLAEGYGHRWAWPRLGATPGHVVISRWPIEPGGELGGPRSTWDQPRVSWVTVTTPAGPVVVVVAHLVNPARREPLRFGARRDRQLGAVCDLLRQLDDGDAPVVLAGDLNATAAERGFDCLERWGDDAAPAVGGAARPTWRPRSWTWVPAVLRIDHVVTSAGLVAVGQDVLCGHAGSDHCPVVTRLRQRPVGDAAGRSGGLAP